MTGLPTDTERSYPEPPRGEWWSDEPQMETPRHVMQMLALIATLRWLWRDRTDYFVGGNLTVYYSPRQRRSEDFRGPDFFVVLGVHDSERDRRSWVVWEEDGRYPNVIVELLSDTTEQNDRGDKKQIYQDIFRTPEYFLFDPWTGELEGFRLVGGHYESIAADARGYLASDQLGLLFGVRDRELRMFTRDGELVPKPEEAAAQAEAHAARADAHVARAEARAAQVEARAARAEALAAKAEALAAEAERRAEEAEAELARLRDELARRGDG
jgi:Uma2 family endonuclease